MPNLIKGLRDFPINEGVNEELISAKNLLMISL
jgi:hypothetical protein